MGGRSLVPFLNGTVIGDFAPVLTPSALRDGNPVRRTILNGGHRREVRYSVPRRRRDQHLAPLDANAIGWTVLEDVQKVPAFPDHHVQQARMVALIECWGKSGWFARGRRRYGYCPVPPGLCAPRLRIPQCPRPSRVATGSSNRWAQLVVVHSSHIEVLLEDALLDRSHNLAAQLWT